MPRSNLAIGEPLPRLRCADRKSLLLGTALASTLLFSTLVSTGTTFILEDHVQDVWGEVSGGVNFFNPTASNSVFAKVDVTFGQDIDGTAARPACGSAGSACQASNSHPSSREEWELSLRSKNAIARFASSDRR